MSKYISHCWEFLIMVMRLKDREYKSFISLVAVDYLPLGWIQSSDMFCFIHRAIFQQYKPIFKYQESSQENTDFFSKSEEIWHPLNLCFYISIIVWIWVVVALLRPGWLLQLAHTPTIIFQHQGRVLVAIYHCYCTVVWIKEEKYYFIPMSLSTAEKTKD